MGTETRQAYEISFHVGFGGVAASLLSAMIFPSLRLFFFFMSFLWTIATLFLFPWVYICYKRGEVNFPPWFRFIS